MKAMINSFHSFSTNDGPGIRGVIFMQGCPLRCKCCHNPETWELNEGQSIESDVLLEKILKGKAYYKNGGITFSGGEPLLQAEFITTMVHKLHQNSLHVTLDTSGCILNDAVINLLKVVDLVLLDVKCNTEEEYQTFAKGSLDKTITFLNLLEELKKPVWIRRVIFKNINDDIASLTEFKQLLAPFSCINKVEFLGFKKMCYTKYLALELPFLYESALEPTNIEIESIADQFEQIKVDK